MDSVATSARALFPKSAGVIKVGYAWRRADSTLDQPRENGPDGWSPVGRVASLAVLHELVDAGFSHVSLVPTGTRNRRSPVSIASLIKWVRVDDATTQRLGGGRAVLPQWRL